MFIFNTFKQNYHFFEWWRKKQLMINLFHHILFKAKMSLNKNIFFSNVTNGWVYFLVHFYVVYLSTNNCHCSFWAGKIFLVCFRLCCLKFRRPLPKGFWGKTSFKAVWIFGASPDFRFVSILFSSMFFFYHFDFNFQTNRYLNRRLSNGLKNHEDDRP